MNCFENTPRRLLEEIRHLILIVLSILEENLEIRQNPKSNTEVGPPKSDDSDSFDDCTLDTKINQGKGRIRKARKPGAIKDDSNDLEEHEKSDNSENSNKARHRIDIDLLELSLQRHV